MLWTIMHAYAEQLFWISNTEADVLYCQKLCCTSEHQFDCPHTETFRQDVIYMGIMLLWLKTNSFYGSIFQLHVKVH